MTDTGRFKNIKRHCSNGLDYCKKGCRKCAEGFKRCNEAYKRSFLCKRVKNKNLFRAILQNILLSYSILLLCQLIFILVNYNEYSSAISDNGWWMILKGNIAFATPAICYLNSLYILLLLFPLHYKEGKLMQRITKLAFVIPNALGVVAELCDCIYTRFTNQRTTFKVFKEFENENNITQIIGRNAMSNWWLIIIGIIIIWLLVRLYTPARKHFGRPFMHYVNIFGETTRYYIWHIVMLLIVVPLMIIGIRGGIGKTVRPITLSNAYEYVKTPEATNLVINTPFAIIRTALVKPFKKRSYYSEEELESIYTPVKQPAPGAQPNKKNVVVIILEGFGKEYIGAYNPRSTGSLTPALDKIIEDSKSYLYSYGNGSKSIDGMPSILSSIPMFVEPFITSSADFDHVSGLAKELGNIGYSSAFFHGAPNGSMGFLAYSNRTGFDEYYGLTEYEKRHGDNDFDGTWAIWDEPFLQYYAECMNEMEEPFITSVFTATSHEPFKIPSAYQDVFRGGSDPFLKSVEYSDYALGQFFEYASKQSWFQNTLFVITADHTNHSTAERYLTASGRMEVPVIFYSPTGEYPFEPGIDTTMIAQQIDIMPTVLEYVGYDRPHISFGKSLISTPAEESYAVNYGNEAFRYYKGEYILFYNRDSEAPISMYNLRKDVLMKENILGKCDVQEEMTRELRAIIQQYMNRMVDDRLTIETDVKKTEE